MGLDSIELRMDFEKLFGIEIPDATAEAMMTPRHVRDFVITEYARLSHTVDPEEIFERIRDVTARITAVKRDKIALDSQFVDDPGLN